MCGGVYSNRQALAACLDDAAVRGAEAVYCLGDLGGFGPHPEACWPLLLGESDGDELGWDHLQCSSSRMVTDQGVWVCPILVNEPSARLGPALADALGPASLHHPACWTCHVYGVSCRT